MRTGVHQVAFVVCVCLPGSWKLYVPMGSHHDQYHPSNLSLAGASPQQTLCQLPGTRVQEGSWLTVLAHSADSAALSRTRCLASVPCLDHKEPRFSLPTKVRNSRGKVLMAKDPWSCVWHRSLGLSVGFLAAWSKVPHSRRKDVCADG